mgnify:CR=1 FL=1
MVNDTESPLSSLSMLHISDLQSQESSLKGLKRRSKIIMVFLIIISLASVIQILNLTVIDQENYVTESEKNRIVRIPVYPSRGLIALSNDNSVIVENIVSQKLTISLNSTEDVVSTISDIQKSIGISQEVIQSFFNVTSSSSRNINITLIDDAYNANPESVKAAIDNLQNYQTEGKKIFVFGDMKELGKDEVKFHEEIADYCEEKIDTIICYGDLAKNTFNDSKNITLSLHFNSKEALSNKVCNLLEKNDIVLLKGSRSMGLDSVAEDIKNYVK